MDAIDRKKQQTDLVVGLGHLLRPLRGIAVEGKTQAEIANACREFNADLKDYRRAADAFAEEYEVERISITRALNLLANQLGHHRDKPDSLARELDTAQAAVTDALLRVPLEVPSLVVGELSPFRAYLTLKTLFSAARTRVMCTDPYMDRTIFHRYVADVDPNAAVLLVTTNKGGRGANRLREVVDVARLYAAERSPTAFTLVQAASAHDRHLVCDNEAHHLGGSLKDAAAKDHYSITPHDLTDAENAIQTLVAGGTTLIAPPP